MQRSFYYNIKVTQYSVSTAGGLPSTFGASQGHNKTHGTERVVGVFPLADQQAIRTRLAKAFRFIVSQRLLPKRGGKGRIAVVEISKSTMRTREYVEKGESEGKSLLDAMRDGTNEGMRHFDGEIEKLIREGIVDFETGITYSTNSGNLRLEMANYAEDQLNKTAARVPNQTTDIETER